MPVCTVQTNLATRDIPGDFITGLSKIIAEVLNKDEQRVMVRLHTDIPMCKAGSTEPCMSVEIWSINVFDEQRSPTYGAKLFEFIESSTPITTDRITMLLHPIEAYNVGKK